MNMDILTWFNENKEWVFSGIGPYLLSGIFGFGAILFGLKSNGKSKKNSSAIQMSQTNAKNSASTQIGKQINVYNYAGQSSPLITAETKDMEQDIFFDMTYKFIACESHTEEDIIRFSAEFASKLNERLQGFSFSLDTPATCEALEEKIHLMKPYRDAYLKVLEHLIVISSASEHFPICVIERFLQDVYSLPCNYTSQKEHYTFFLWNICLSSSTMMLFYKKYAILSKLIHKEFLAKPGSIFSVGYNQVKMSELEFATPVLDSKFPRKKSHAALLLLNEEFKPSVTKENITSADVILCQLSICHNRWDKYNTWHPRTLEFFQTNSLIIDFWADLKSRRRCNELIKLFDVEDIHNLKRVVEENGFNSDMHDIKANYAYVPYIAEFIRDNEVASKE